jgi:hypothetical protein
MNLDRSRLLGQLRSNDGWIADIRRLAGALRTTTRREAGLLVVGPPTDEPWHLVAHLDQEARLGGLTQLSPVLVRHHVPAGAAPHLAVDLSRLNTARPGETVFVVASVAAPADLLSRVEDARRAGATILALEAGDDPDLQGLAHETVTVSRSAATGSALGRQFETAQHLVSLAVGQPSSRSARRARRLVLKR